jgi:hypothetical protein
LWLKWFKGDKDEKTMTHDKKNFTLNARVYAEGAGERRSPGDPADRSASRTGQKL